MSDNNRLEKELKEYLSETNTKPTSEEIEPEKIIQQIEALVEMDITVQSGLLKRSPSSRAKKIGMLAFQIAGSLFKEVPHYDARELVRTSPKVQRAYNEMLGELYELAALMEVFKEYEGPLGAIAKWQEYIFYAEGHPDEKNRIQIARTHLNLLLNI